MLKLVVGRAGSGKTEYCINEIERLARDGKRSILIVPEQSSFSLERTLALRLEGKLAEFNEIKSFKKLCNDIFSECGGGAKRRATDAEKCAILRRAILAVDSDIQFYRRHKRNRAFFELAVSVINELKNGGVSPELLRSTAKNAKTPLSKDKMNELALIYESYNAMLGNQFYDDADELAAAAKLSATASQFDELTVFLDGYSGFTEPEYILLSNLMTHAADLVCTFVCEDIFSEEEDSFFTVRKSALRLKSYANKKSVLVAKPVELNHNFRFKNNGLSHAERYFANKSIDKLSNEGIFKITGQDLYDESEKIASEIRLLVQNESMSYSDIAIIARDTDRYSFAIQRTFFKYEIPLFSDINRNMLHSPLVILLLNAFGLCKGFDSEHIFRFLKTGLCDIDEQTISEMEDYCFVWGIDGNGWLSVFDKKPDGFGEISGEKTKEKLVQLEETRIKIVNWLAPLTSAGKTKSASGIIGIVYEFFENCGAIEHVEKADDTQKREAQIAITLIEKLYELVGDEFYNIDEIIDFATLLASTTTVGEIPKSLEQVTFGSADRMRTHNPRAVFLVGLNEGIFPKNNFDSPILSSVERDLLFENGAQLSRSFEQSAVMEKLYLYRAASSSTERLYFCSAASDQKGTGLQQSAEIEELLSQIGTQSSLYEKKLFPKLQNKKTAASEYAIALEKNDLQYGELIKQSNFADACELVENASAEPEFTVKDKTLPHALMGEKSALSASKIENFGMCRFQYFLRYMMHIRPLKKAEISPLEAGSFVHDIMENTLKSFDGDLTVVNNEMIRAAVHKYSQEFVDRHMGDVANQPRMKYLIERLKAQSVRLVLQLKREQLQSEFRPVDYELEIGFDAQIEPIKMQTLSGETVYIEGKIDRVDVFLHEGKSYIRVVDYKTGDKAFRLVDVFYGLNVQMLLYLFSICKNGHERYKNPVPAGVLYMPSDPRAPSVKADAEKEARKAYRMDGLVINDSRIVEAMEKNAEGIFIPARMNEHGIMRKDDKIASLEKFGAIERKIEETVFEMANALYAGEWDINPAVYDNGASACKYCDYAAVCRHDRSDKKREIKKLDSSEMFSEEVSEK